MDDQGHSNILFSVYLVKLSLKLLDQSKFRINFETLQLGIMMSFISSLGRSSSLRIAMLLLCSVFATSVAFASGGDGGGGSGGSSGGSSGGGNGIGYTVSKSTYELGKKVFQEHVICESCPYADLEHTSESVGSVWGQLKKDLKKRGTIGENLERKERRSVKAFIRKRFDL